MSMVRVALANVRIPGCPEESVDLATSAVAEAGRRGAAVVCFPECFIPGYRWSPTSGAPPDPAFLERAWADVADAAKAARVTVILGTERIVNDVLLATALVIRRDGSIAGFQDKVQIDPSEEITYGQGSERRLFQDGSLTFGVAICHEGWRYPETVRWAGWLPLKHTSAATRSALSSVVTTKISRSISSQTNFAVMMRQSISP